MKEYEEGVQEDQTVVAQGSFARRLSRHGVRLNTFYLCRNDAAQLMAEVAQKANQIHQENQNTKKMLLEQIQMFEVLFKDRHGMEIAYRRMHHINDLVKEIEIFSQTKYNKCLKEVIIELPQQLIQKDNHESNKLKN